MLWYGSFNYKNSVYNYNLNNKFSNKKKTINFLLPNDWHILIVSNKYSNLHQIFLYSKNYYLKTIIFEKKPLIYYDFNTKQFFISVCTLNNYAHLYLKIIKNFYLNLVKPTFIKLKFKGKGYYIYKNYRNTITPQFGYSHRLYLYSFYTNVKFLNKTTLVCFGLNLNNIKLVSNTLYNWRPVNIFTGRGVRFSKQLIYKKSGKVSSYR